MRWFGVACLVGMCAGAGLAGAQGDVVDRDGIATLLDEWARSWARHDAEALAALWSPSGDFVSATGEVASGRVQLTQLFESEQEGFMKGTQIAVKLTRARSMGEGTAFIDCEVLLRGVQAEGGRAMPPLEHQLSAVVTKSDAGWRFLAARLSVPVPAPPG